MEHSGMKEILLFILEDNWKLLILITALFGLYRYYTSTFDYFEKKGIPFIKPTILLGNLGLFLSGKSIQEVELSIYKHFKGKPCGGIFRGRKPLLYVFDPDIIKAVTIRDFEHFTDRNAFNLREPKCYSRFLINLESKEWKGVRNAASPTFSSARLKNMMPIMQSCAQQLIDFFQQYDGKEVELKVAIGNYTLETFGACAYGIECNALNGEKTHFAKVAERLTDISKANTFLLMIALILAPKILRYLNIHPSLNKESSEELLKILKAAKVQRRSSATKRNDFLQLLIDAAEKEKIDSKDGKSTKYMDDDTIDAQSLFFLLGGYDSISTLLAFAIHVLATKPSLQDSLRANIVEQTNGKEISFELMSQLHYLEAFLLETLRMYPPVTCLDRLCTKQYILPNTSVSVDVGDIIMIPNYGIHMDPDYYPNPEEFKPERFMHDEKRNRPQHLFLGFGAGPRNCIGLRFAMLSAKLAMVSMLKNFKFSVCEKTEDPIKFDKYSYARLTSSTGLWVNVERL